MYRILLFIVLFSCHKEPSVETKLSGNAGKFWHLKTIVRLKENIEEKKDFQVLQFYANHKLVEYRFDKQQLKKVQYTCYSPPQKWKLKSKNQLLLNEEIFTILKLTQNHMVLYSKGRNLKLVYGRYKRPT
jgi:hypothetical protein